ncbi:MAG: nitroreductase family protein [Porphyromonadaceae bacterium]|nr:nitroreductase family protein [Porphyromonadaceae bacterium]
MMQLIELLKRNRSYRRFDRSIRPSQELMSSWIEGLRYTASARNMQPLKYVLVTDDALCHTLSQSVVWAGYLPEWPEPNEDERPTAFVIQILDTRLSSSARFDEGLQLEALGLMAVESGFGACIFLSFDPKRIAAMLDLPEYLTPISIVAIGKPIEEVEVRDVEAEADIRYYRDEAKRHYVPKRKREELIYRAIK